MNNSVKAQLYEGYILISITKTLKWAEVAIKPSILK